MIGFEIDS